MSNVILVAEMAQRMVKIQNTCHQCSGSGTIIRQTRTPIGFVRQSHTCVTCNGIGNIIKENCDKCFGLGILKNQREEIDINIPRGARQGMEFAVRNKGRRPCLWWCMWRFVSKYI